jgi:hypothetical protein
MPRNASPSTARRLALVGLVLFVLLDAVLVAWALSVDRDDPGGARVPAASSTPEPAAAPTATPTSGPAAAPARLLSVLDEDTAWRSEVGNCPDSPPTLELTTDGGRNWRSSDLAGIADVGAVAAVETTTEDVAAVVALDSDSCDPVLALSYVAGDDWVTYPERVAGHWFLNPDSPSVLHTPAGELPAPCATAVSLASRGESDAAVLCADHTVHRTTDAGGTWSEPVPVAGSVALAADEDGYLLATTGQLGCAGVAVASLPDEATAPAADPACASTSAPESGQVALAAGGGSAWLWAGDDVVTSSDGGATWR